MKPLLIVFILSPRRVGIVIRCYGWMILLADRVLDARRTTWQDTDKEGRHLRRTMGIASLGGATLDNEENYLMKKLYTAMGAIQVENQARI